MSKETKLKRQLYNIWKSYSIKVDLECSRLFLGVNTVEHQLILLEMTHIDFYNFLFGVGVLLYSLFLQRSGTHSCLSGNHI